MTEKGSDRAALRELMSELSEEAYCAAWHYDTEYRLWEILIGRRDQWMRLSGDDPRLSELRRLHEQTGGWWRWNPGLDSGWGDTEFVLTEKWVEIYVATVGSNDRAVSAVIDGKVLHGQAAVDATAKILRLRKAEP